VSLEGVGSAFAATRDGIDALLRDRGLRRTSPETTADSLARGAVASGQLEDVPAPLALYAELVGLAPVLVRAPLQALARIHVLVAKGTRPDDELGRPRDADGAAVLRDLARLLATPTSAPALVMAAVVHAEIATKAPFSSHNGVIARATERALLVAKGVDPTSLTVPEAGHLALRPQYESNLRAYASGATQAWLLYAAEAFTAGAEASPLER
jgi:hypothetical protein